MRGLIGVAEHGLAGITAAHCRAVRTPRRYWVFDPDDRCPPVHVVEAGPDLLIEFPSPLGDRLRATLARDADSGWIVGAAELMGALPLGESTFDHGLAPALEAELTAGHGDPGRRVAAANLVQVIALTDRIVSWAQAVQTQAMAALARPGVAAPIGDLLELTTHGGRVSPDGSDPSEVLSDKDFEATCFAEVSVAGTPEWDVVVREEATRLASAEVGVALGLPPATAAHRLSESVELVDRHPRAVDCWRTARIDRQRVRAFAARTVGLDASMVAEVESVLLSDGGTKAGATTCVTLRRRLEREIARRDPAASRRRRKVAREDRGVFVQPGDDGMSRFCADLPAPVALLAHEVVDTIARGLPEGARAGRTAAQARADVFGDIVTQLAAFGRVDLRIPGSRDADTRCSAADPGEETDTASGDRVLPVCWEALGASVSVVVDADVFSRCATDDLPVLEQALLERYGDLPTDLAHALAVSARRARVLIPQTQADPEQPAQAPSAPDGRAVAVADAVADTLSQFCSVDGLVPVAGAAVRPLDAERGAGLGRYVGRKPAAQQEPQDAPPVIGDQQVGHWAYRPDRETAERVVQRDRVCRFPGCRRPARQCDLDHRIPYDKGGPTTFDNLDVLCRYHHRIKTHAGWRAIRLPGNRMRWTSPLGAELIDEPEVDTVGRGDRTSRSHPPTIEDDPPPF